MNKKINCTTYWKGRDSHIWYRLHHTDNSYGCEKKKKLQTKL